MPDDDARRTRENLRLELDILTSELPDRPRSKTMVGRRPAPERTEGDAALSAPSTASES